MKLIFSFSDTLSVIKSFKDCDILPVTAKINWIFGLSVDLSWFVILSISSWFPLYFSILDKTSRKCDISSGLSCNWNLHYIYIEQSRLNCLVPYERGRYLDHLEHRLMHFLSRFLKDPIHFLQTNKKNPFLCPIYTFYRSEILPHWSFWSPIHPYWYSILLLYKKYI